MACELMRRERRYDLTFFVGQSLWHTIFVVSITFTRQSGMNPERLIKCSHC